MNRIEPPRNKTGFFSSFSGKKGLIALLVVIAVIIALVAALFTMGNPGASPSVSPQECSRVVISYLNNNIVQANSTTELISVAEKNGVYMISTRYQGRNITVYATKDCNLLFTSAYNMKSTPQITTSATPTQPPEPVRTARPTAELFVMSFCPYGVQAETAMEPVLRILGNKSDITIRYIARVQGTTLKSVNSLHGPVEAREDARQLCVAKYYPSQLWPYLTYFNSNCYPLRQNATALDACTQAATQKTGIDNQKIEICATGSEGLNLLKADEAITTANKVSGSPTLIINGQRYSGQRTPEAYKQAICARFTNPPAECSVNLSTQAAAASGSCG